MDKYRLKTGKMAGTIVDAYKKVETAFQDAFLAPPQEAGGLPALKTGKIGKAVTDSYRKIEGRVVGGYKKVQDAFVDTFLEKVDTADQTSWAAGDGKK